MRVFDRDGKVSQISARYQIPLNRWDELGLPELDLQAPWHGYPLTQWTEENAEEAELAVTGRYYETGEKLAGRREDTE